MKASCVAILGILGRVIVVWDTKKHKKRRFSAWKLINSLTTQKPLDVLNWTLDTMWELMNAYRKPSLGAPGPVPKLLQAENGQTVDEFEPISVSCISVTTDIDEKKFVISKHTFNHLSFGYASLPGLEYYFFCFVSFFLLYFSFFSHALWF